MNATSLKFKFIEDNLNKMLILMVNNQTIKRYIKYLDQYPLDPSLPDIADNLINKNIMLTPYDPTVLTDMQVKVFFTPYKGNLKNIPLGNDIYLIDIIVPIKYWLITGKGEIRVFRIAEEIAKMFDNQSVAGVGRVYLTDYSVYKVNDSYAGLNLLINVINSNVGVSV